MALDAPVLLLAVILTNALLLPVFRRMRAPGWAIRLRGRPRTGVLVRIWFVAGTALTALWLIGEQRGVWNGLMLLLWIGVPLGAIRLTAFLFRK